MQHSSIERGRRLLIYSHDSFGLGHLRRCHAIAHDLVDRFAELSVLILSGSPIIGSFEFKPRVDFVRIPGVIKLRDGQYTSLNLDLTIEKTLELRSSIIEQTARVFAPDVFLVDKEPLGLRGEVQSALRLLRTQGACCILGLRDVMDDPASLTEEWLRKGVFPALEALYDEILVYGLPEMLDPLAEVPGMSAVADKVRFTGYIRRSSDAGGVAKPVPTLPDRPFVLVTAGGGGDGANLIDWVISAYEEDPSIPFGALILFGPFMHLDDRTRFLERVNNLSQVEATTFDTHIEMLYEQAIAVVAMGGYNTFCEILSFGKPSLIVPRTQPRLEQLLRAQRAERLGLVTMLPDDDKRDPRQMADQLRRAGTWPRPNPALRTRMLRGLDRFRQRFHDHQHHGLLYAPRHYASQGH